jgi:flagellar P-ring protein precursor FlgI
MALLVARVRTTFVVFGLALTLLALLLAGEAQAVRIKDMASIKGVRGNQLMGYGLVVGLKGTGDKQQVTFTMQALANLAERMGGVKVPSNTLRVQNVASVLVTSTLPPFARVGSRIDVTISSIGDCQSLLGGTLLITPLKGADNELYALAQGPLVVGGFSAGGAAGGGQQKNHPTVGRIAGGATVERELPGSFQERQTLTLALGVPDFTTAGRVAQAINQHLGGGFAKAADSGTVLLATPPAFKGRMVELVAEIEPLEVTPDLVAKVILDERTGTVVMGENVKLVRLAVAHGNLSITIKEYQDVSQPQPFGEGETKVTRETDVEAKEEEQRLVLVPEGVTIGDVVRALNAIGVTPRDLISVFQAIKASGALQAELEVI